MVQYQITNTILDNNHWHTNLLPSMLTVWFQRNLRFILGKNMLNS